MSLAGRARQSAARLGLDVSRADPRSALGKHLELLIRELDVLHVVDVGANKGQFATLIREEARFAGRIDSCEPVSGTFQDLRAAMSGDAQWHGHHVAVTDTEGDVTLNIFPSSLFNSLASLTNEGERVFDDVHGETFRSTGTETVRGVPLDALGLPDLGRTMLKVDTQGHDWSVLTGAQAVLARTVLISMELAFVQFYDTAVPAWESIKRLEQMGYGLAGIYQAAPAADGLRIGEADGLFVRIDG